MKKMEPNSLRILPFLLFHLVLSFASPPTYKSPPKHVHLSLSKSHEMTVMWLTDFQTSSQVHYSITNNGRNLPGTTKNGSSRKIDYGNGGFMHCKCLFLNTSDELI